MKKKYIVSALMFAFCGISGTWAQTDLTPNNDKTVWSIAGMPAYDVELQVEYYTDLLETSDNSAWLTTNSGGTASVWLGRTLQPDSYNTLALPFSMAIPDGWDVKELASSSFESTKGELTLNFSDANTIEAGKPYLVKISGSEAITLTGYNDVTIGNANPSTTDYVNFVPTLGRTLVTGPTGDENNAKAVLYLGANNTLYNPTVVNLSTNLNSHMKGFRAYFQLKDAAALNARAFRMNFGDEEVTGIMTTNFTNDTNDMNGQWYTIDGRKFSGQPTQKGVYINNGKKIVIK
jgi:hypothetical protein